MVMVGEVWIVFTNNLPFNMHNVVFTIFVIYLGLMLGDLKHAIPNLDTIKWKTERLFILCLCFR